VKATRTQDKQDTKKKQLTLKIRGRYKPTIYDTFTGKRFAPPYEINSDKTIYLNAEKSDIKANRAESVYVKGELNTAPKEGEQSLLTLNGVVIKGITK
jgi:hypothetical protein